jgi:hypothetical protein
MFSEHPLLAYAHTDGIASCQTKLVMGSLCGKSVMKALKPSDIAEAKRRIRYDFLFIGYSLSRFYPYLDL